MPKKNILLAMFDIKPINRSEDFDFENLPSKVDLRSEPRVVAAVEQDVNEEPLLEEPRDMLLSEEHEESSQEAEPEVNQEVPASDIEETESEVEAKDEKRVVLEEFEEAIGGPVDVFAELTRAGGILHSSSNPKPRLKLILSKKKFEPIEEIKAEDPFVQPAKIKLPEPRLVRKNISSPLASDVLSPASRELEVWLSNIKKDKDPFSASPNRTLRAVKTRLTSFVKPAPKLSYASRPKINYWQKLNKKTIMYAGGFLLAAFLVFSLAQKSTIGVRDNLIQNGNNAVANLEEAKKDLENFDFLKAADSFALAYDDFNRASGTLSQLGASFISVFGDLPGLGKIKAANNLVAAGQHVSKAGENLSVAFGTLYKTNLLSFLDTNGGRQSGSLSVLLSEFRDVLLFAEENITKADKLLADIDVESIPEDKQELFLSFKDKIPQFQEYIGDAVDYSDFMLKFVGDRGTKTYILLLQNNSELRPTGGFPGTYALVTFDKGNLKRIFIDDVYQIDGQIKENIIPPTPLQHITPNWGMRDANWFADFPTSAKKIQEFYKLDGGGNVDGVLTITPDVIAQIFDIIGPIDMPEYNVTLDSSNFLTEIQSEVEYGDNRVQPKQIVKDLQPKFFEKLSQQDKDSWVGIFKVILEAAEEKHILASFNDSSLEEVAVKNGFGGEIRQASGDYLQVVLANIKGSKTDFVTDNSLDLQTEVSNDNSASHTLTINRSHRGGDYKYGFYNRVNTAYIKVYVPKGSVIEGINGHSITDHRPLLPYPDYNFKKDPDLERIESGIYRPFAGVDVFEESGKTVFGFWLNTGPGQNKSVVVKYKVPAQLTGSGYSLLWQKQSGTNEDKIKFGFKLPDGKQPLQYNSELQPLGDSLILSSDLAVDREINIKF
ncbi:MAG: DUF4012 domain-containing protein [Candidatus Paceibacterota bacterium]